LVALGARFVLMGGGSFFWGDLVFFRGVYKKGGGCCESTQSPPLGGIPTVGGGGPLLVCHSTRGGGGGALLPWGGVVVSLFLGGPLNVVGGKGGGGVGSMNKPKTPPLCPHPGGSLGLFFRFLGGLGGGWCLVVPNGGFPQFFQKGAYCFPGNKKFVVVLCGWFGWDVTFLGKIGFPGPKPKKPFTLVFPHFFLTFTFFFFPPICLGFFPPKKHSHMSLPPPLVFSFPKKNLGHQTRRGGGFFCVFVCLVGWRSQVFFVFSPPFMREWVFVCGQKTPSPFYSGLYLG